jgi:hypothetical protein
MAPSSLCDRQHFGRQIIDDGIHAAHSSQQRIHLKLEITLDHLLRSLRHAATAALTCNVAPLLQRSAYHAQ